MAMIIKKAHDYAIKCHAETNHLYDGKPYEFHLRMVFRTALMHQRLVHDSMRNDFLAAAWAHDVIDDCRQTYNDVKNSTNAQVAELVFALTNEKGKTRKDRANEKYYQDMKSVPYAPLLKICDRLANVRYSLQTNSRMAGVYARENEDFISMVDDGKCDSAIRDLRELVDVYKERHLVADNTKFAQYPLTIKELTND